MTTKTDWPKVGSKWKRHIKTAVQDKQVVALPREMQGKQFLTVTEVVVDDPLGRQIRGVLSTKRDLAKPYSCDAVIFTASWDPV